MNIISNYKELYNEHNLVIFDLETTGLNKNSDRIIEIGAIKVVNGIIVDTISTLVNPGIEVPYYATKVNGITNHMISNKMSDSEGIQLFLNLLDNNSYIVAHNVNFDIGFINAYLNRLNRETITNKLVDTVKLARKAFPGRHRYSLGEIAKFLGINVENAHRAYDDTRVCYELYQKSIIELKKLESIK